MTYDYKCNSCGIEFEAQQSINDKPHLKCSTCGNESLVRLITQGNFVLKGGGWAADNYSTKK